MELRRLVRCRKGQLRVVEALLACLIIMSALVTSMYFANSYLGTRRGSMEALSINVSGIVGSQYLIEKVEKQEGNWEQDIKSCLESLLPLNTFYELRIYSSLKGKDIATISNIAGENITSGMNTATARRVVTVSLPMRRDASKPIDAMLVLDRSGSMAETLIGDSHPKIEHMKNASKYFVDSLNMSVARVGLSSFADSASLNQHLLNNSVVVKQSINGLVASGWTCMGGAIKLAVTEFNQSGRHETSWAAILISDGVPNVDENGNVNVAAGQRYALQQAARLSSLGVDIYTIGLGSTSNFNATLLKQIQTAGYYYAPSAQQLEEIYDMILRDLTFRAQFDIVLLELTVMSPGRLE
ncbi:VWA domain-containing protein [Candidatus Bathyarchaeota archaeon]|nr:VWA domain-containing protein [Candidatus Bathyarchaeota archaeon]